MAITQLYGSRQIKAGTITNTEQAFGTPVSATDVAIKSYVDSVAQGLDPKPSVMAATIAVLSPSNTYANGTAGLGATLTAGSNGILTVDGYNTVINDYILVKNQAAGLQNGIYKVTTEGTAGVPYVLTRAIEMDNTLEFSGGFTFVTGGSTLGGTGWVCSNGTAPTVGTTAITFTQFSGAGTYTASTGLTLTGSAFSIDTTVTVDKTTAQVLTNKDLTSGTNTFPTFNQSTTGSALSLKSNATTGLMQIVGPAIGTTRVKTILDSNDTLLELAGSYTPTGTWTSIKINENVAVTTTSTKLNYLTSATGTTGTASTNVVFSTSPTLVTPILGVASATSLATSAATPLLLTNGQLVNIALTSQTVGATTLTIPNFASVSDTFVFTTLAQTLSNKTFVAPALGTPASGVMTNVTGTASGLTSGITLALKSASTTVDVSAATAPSSGQVLTATSSTTATWQPVVSTAYQRSTAVSGTQDSANKVFTIANAVSSGSEQVYVNGMLMMPGSSNDYVISSTTVTFQAGFTAPASTDTIRVYGTY